MQRILLISLLLSLLLVTPALANPAPNTGSALSEERKPKDIIIETDMRINLVMVGERWTVDDRENIRSRLVQTYTPMIYFENRSAGMTYDYEYNFYSIPQEKASELFAFMKSIAVENDVPPPIKQWISNKEPAFWGLDFVNISKKKYKVIDAYQVEVWLYENLVQDKGYTLYFFKPPKDQIDFFHTYGTITRDPDTYVDFIGEGMMGFGGKHRFYFIDLTAGPWLYPFVPVSESQVFAQFHKNLYDARRGEDYYRLIADYVNDAVMLLFTPSYLYTPVYKPHFRLDVFLVDMTAGRAFEDLSAKFIDKPTVINALTKLIPHAEWSADITGQSFAVLPRDLQKAVLGSMSIRKIPGGDMIVVKSNELITELNKWVTSNLTEEQQRLAQEEAANTVFVPAIIFVFDTDAYVDKVPVLGTAAPDPTNETVPCCAVVVVDERVLFGLGSGLSTLTIHEIGHVLGLRHPHDGHDPVRGEFNNWFFDWSHTPLSYISPASLGCGFPDVPCGLVVQEYGQFDHDAMDRGLVLYLLNQAQLNVYDSMRVLEDKQYNERNLPASVRAALDSIDLDATRSVEEFDAMNYFNHTGVGEAEPGDADDSFDFALRALSSSEQLVEQVSGLELGKLRPDVISVSEPFFVDTAGNKLETATAGEAVGVVAKISSDANQNVTFAYIVQIKDADGSTLFLTWIDFNIETAGAIKMSPSIFWTPERAGKVGVEIFVWQGVNNPAPLAPPKSTTLMVTG